MARQELARALRLTPAERSHLFRLAGSSAPPGISAVRRVRPHGADAGAAAGDRCHRH